MAQPPEPLDTPGLSFLSGLWRKLINALHEWIGSRRASRQSRSIFTSFNRQIGWYEKNKEPEDEWVVCIALTPGGWLQFRRPPDSYIYLDSVFGQTWRCEGRLVSSSEKVLERPVAVKFLRPVMLGHGTDYETGVTQLRDRVQREVDLISGLRHPNVAPLLAYHQGETLDDQHLVTPWYPNDDLLRWAEEDHSWSEKTRMIEGIASGLAYLSTKKVIHGDLRPINILIDENYNPIISDFGLSVAWTPGCASDLEDVRPIARVGDFVRWLSRERLDFGDVSLADDIYAFGCLILFVMTGKIPYFTARSHREFWIQQRSSPPSSPSHHPELPLRADSLWWQIMQNCWLPASPSAEQAEQRRYRPPMKSVFGMVQQAPPIGML